MPATQVTEDEDIATSKPDEDDDTYVSEPNDDHLELVRAFYKSLPIALQLEICSRLKENEIPLKNGRGIVFHIEMYDYPTVRETESKFTDVERALFASYVSYTKRTETASKLNFAAAVAMVALSAAAYFKFEESYPVAANVFAVFVLLLMLTAIGVSMNADFMKKEYNQNVAAEGERVIAPNRRGISGAMLARFR